MSRTQGLPAERDSLRCARSPCNCPGCGLGGTVQGTSGEDVLQNVVRLSLDSIEEDIEETHFAVCRGVSIPSR